MPQVDVEGLTINYDVQGEGEPLLLIPYLSADHACYAFQLPAYTEHFSCIAIDLPGSGESDKPAGPYSTDVYADQVDAFLGAIAPWPSPSTSRAAGASATTSTSRSPTATSRAPIAATAIAAPPSRRALPRRASSAPVGVP